MPLYQCEQARLCGTSEPQSGSATCRYSPTVCCSLKSTWFPSLFAEPPLSSCSLVAPVARRQQETGCQKNGCTLVFVLLNYNKICLHSFLSISEMLTYYWRKWTLCKLYLVWVNWWVKIQLWKYCRKTFCVKTERVLHGSLCYVIMFCHMLHIWIMTGNYHHILCIFDSRSSIMFLRLPVMFVPPYTFISNCSVCSFNKKV